MIKTIDLHRTYLPSGEEYESVTIVAVPCFSPEQKAIIESCLEPGVQLPLPLAYYPDYDDED